MISLLTEAHVTFNDENDPLAYNRNYQQLLSQYQRQQYQQQQGQPYVGGPYSPYGGVYTPPQFVNHPPPQPEYDQAMLARLMGLLGATGQPAERPAQSPPPADRRIRPGRPAPLPAPVGPARRAISLTDDF